MALFLFLIFSLFSAHAEPPAPCGKLVVHCQPSPIKPETIACHLRLEDQLLMIDAESELFDALEKNVNSLVRLRGSASDELTFHVDSVERVDQCP